MQCYSSSRDFSSSLRLCRRLLLCRHFTSSTDLHSRWWWTLYISYSSKRTYESDTRIQYYIKLRRNECVHAHTRMHFYDATLSFTSVATKKKKKNGEKEMHRCAPLAVCIYTWMYAGRTTLREKSNEGLMILARDSTVMLVFRTFGKNAHPSTMWLNDCQRWRRVRFKTSASNL